MNKNCHVKGVIENCSLQSMADNFIIKGMIENCNWKGEVDTFYGLPAQINNIETKQILSSL